MPTSCIRNVVPLLGLIFVQHYIVLGQEVSTNRCPQATDCSGCMQADPRCGWCLDDDYLKDPSKSSRCDLRSALEQPNACNNITSTNSQSNIESNKEFDNVIQVRPEIVNVTLRPGQPATFNVSVKPAPDFPVDIYFLVDGSFSMEDDLANIRTLGGAIASNISEITKNFRLGFGTFVDKEAVPFIEGPQSPNFPCNYRGANCTPVYPYRHLLDFTNDTTLFQERVGQASNELSGDLDTPEGGFDGLMQTTKCEQLIGWKPQGKARRIVLLVTDALPKIAGDGQLIGGLVQNDGKCHLSPLENNSNILSYNASTTMDYPSISQLREAMQQNAITPILAVSKTHINIYKEIADAWSSVLALTGELSGNSDNIVNLVRDNYQKISSLVRLINSANNNLIFNYKPLSPNCTNRPGSGPNQCPNVNIGEQVDFEVSVTARSCPTDLANAKKSAEIDIPGFGAVQININYLCDCECTRAAEGNSPSCSGNGTLECGICKCNEGIFGDICHCDESNLAGDSLNNTLLPCLSDPSDNTTICSNQGSCICGQCVCNIEKEPDRKISGPFCQCKNFGCPSHGTEECGAGENRGECVCGACQCREEFDGDNCGENNCTYVEEKICTRNGVICSNQGNCDCGSGKCNCDPGYDGKYCENCITNQCKCSDYENCVLCRGLEKADANCTGCEYYGIVEVADPDVTCTVRINATCFAVFNYEGRNDTANDTIYWAARCPDALVGDGPNLLAIVLGTIAAIIFIGLLLLLLWKLLLLLQGRREYRKFESSKGKSQWEQDLNPIYVQPDQKFDNPVFNAED